MVMDALRAARTVFHSEADFQHAFAWAVHCLDNEVQVRLEVRQEQKAYLDLLCFGPKGRTAIEFKYFTARWDGVDPRTGEQFRLRHHGAPDLARLGFVVDIARLERFCQSGPAAMNGLAVLLTNDRGMWSPPTGYRLTRDGEFRLHEGRRLRGMLRWGTEGSYFLANQRDLLGDYPLTWRDFARLNGGNGEFRWLAVQVHQAKPTTADVMGARCRIATGSRPPAAPLRFPPG
nr:hypothetical protein OHB51_19360 [Micromonospora sp. NBC_00855]